LDQITGHHPTYTELDGIRPMWLTLRRTRTTLLISVRDTNPQPPVPKQAADDEEGGRGLLLITALSRRWGHYYTGPYKIVWCEVACTSTLHGSLTASQLAHGLYGLVRSLKRDLDGGSLATFREIEHATLLGHFLELAEHAVGVGRTGPAAILLGAILETHLRHLAAKNEVALTTPATETGSRDEPRPPEQLNDDLAQVAYDTPDRQMVTAWLGILANAGQSRARTLATIRDLRTFIARHPA
jgi:hypothetical protein